jgi:hypothetical protein
MLLERVTFATDVSIHFATVREPNTGDFAQCRVGLLRGRRVDAQANTPALRGLLEVRCFRHLPLGRTSLANELLNGGHKNSIAPVQISLRTFFLGIRRTNQGTGP